MVDIYVTCLLYDSIYPSHVSRTPFSRTTQILSSIISPRAYGENRSMAHFSSSTSVIKGPFGCFKGGPLCL